MVTDNNCFILSELIICHYMIYHQSNDNSGEYNKEMNVSSRHAFESRRPNEWMNDIYLALSAISKYKIYKEHKIIKYTKNNKNTERNTEKDF